MYSVVILLFLSLRYGLWWPFCGGVTPVELKFFEGRASFFWTHRRAVLI